MASVGTVYLIGAVTGAPDFLTVSDLPRLRDAGIAGPAFLVSGDVFAVSACAVKEFSQQSAAG